MTRIALAAVLVLLAAADLAAAPVPKEARRWYTLYAGPFRDSDDGRYYLHPDGVWRSHLPVRGRYPTAKAAVAAFAELKADSGPVCGSVAGPSAGDAPGVVIWDQRQGYYFE